MFKKTVAAVEKRPRNEGGRTAFNENSHCIEKNKEAILQLREENNRLYKNLAAANESDKRVVKEAFHNVDKSSEKGAFRNMSGKTALATLDRKLLSKKKGLNAQKHITQTLKDRVSELKLECEKLKSLWSNVSKTPDSGPQKREDDAMKMRILENNLQKTRLKYKEAENIRRYYLTLKSHLQKESQNFSRQLDNLEAEILKHKGELQNLQGVNHEAQLSAEVFKAELKKKEDLLCKERKGREEYRKNSEEMFEENKFQAEKVERRAQRTAVQPDKLRSEAQRSTTRKAGEDKAISTFEDVFRQIKDATGVTNIQEIAERFLTQKAIHKHLMKLMDENKNTLAQFKEQEEQLSQQFEGKKYSTNKSTDRQKYSMEAIVSREQENLCAQDKTLATVQAGVERLTDKLQFITLSKEDTLTMVPTDSRLVDLLSECELKLQTLYTELQEKDISGIMKMMEEEKEKLPIYNTRILLPEDYRQELLNDEEESNDDEAGIISREALKRQSQLIVDSKLKKKKN